MDIRKVFKKRDKGDSRFTFFRVIHGNKKVSVSYHAKWHYWMKSWREFRITFCGINVHFRES